MKASLRFENVLKKHDLKRTSKTRCESYGTKILLCDNEYSFIIIVMNCCTNI